MQKNINRIYFCKLYSFDRPVVPNQGAAERCQVYRINFENTAFLLVFYCIGGSAANCYFWPSKGVPKFFCRIGFRESKRLRNTAIDT